jgi:hypothetical protein
VRGVWMFVLPFGAVLGLGALVTVFGDQGALAPEAPAQAIGFDEVVRSSGRVRVEGMAHYASTITQRVPGGLIAEDRTYYVFGVFPKHDVSSRAIPLLVRTSRPPERLVSFEVMEIEGRLGPIDTRRIPPSTEAVLSGKTEYWFADEVKLLDVERIYSEDGEWIEP